GHGAGGCHGGAVVRVSVYGGADGDRGDAAGAGAANRNRYGRGHRQRLGYGIVGRGADRDTAPRRNNGGSIHIRLDLARHGGIRQGDADRSADEAEGERPGPDLGIDVVRGFRGREGDIPGGGGARARNFG